VSRLFGDVDFGYADYQVRADHTLGGGRATLFALGSFDHLDIKDQQIGDAALNFHRLDLRWDGASGAFRCRRGPRSRRTTRSRSSTTSRSASGRTASRRGSRSCSVRGVRRVGVDGEAQRFSTDTAFATRDGMRPTPPALLADLARTAQRAVAARVRGGDLHSARLKVEPACATPSTSSRGHARRLRAAADGARS
jgi:hypothetical protein